MIIAIYARVSTSDQSCEMQLHELRQYVAKQGWQVFQEYVDTGFSGAAASRPRLDQLLGDARLQKDSQPCPRGQVKHVLTMTAWLILR